MKRILLLAFVLIASTAFGHMNPTWTLPGGQAGTVVIGSIAANCVPYNTNGTDLGWKCSATELIYNESTDLLSAGAYSGTSANQAATGLYRLANGQKMCWRNDPSSFDVCHWVNASEHYIIDLDGNGVTDFSYSDVGTWAFKIHDTFQIADPTVITNSAGIGYFVAEGGIILSTDDATFVPQLTLNATNITVASTHPFLFGSDPADTGFPFRLSDDQGPCWEDTAEACSIYDATDDQFEFLNGSLHLTMIGSGATNTNQRAALFTIADIAAVSTNYFVSLDIAAKHTNGSGTNFTKTIRLRATTGGFSDTSTAPALGIYYDPGAGFNATPIATFDGSGIRINTGAVLPGTDGGSDLGSNALGHRILFLETAISDWEVKTITDDTQTSFVQISCPSGDMVGGEVEYVVYAENGTTEAQAEVGTIQYNCINLTGTEVCATPTERGTPLHNETTGGTADMTTTWTCSTSPTNAIQLQVQANTGIASPTLMAIRYRTHVNGSDAPASITVTPQ